MRIRFSNAGNKVRLGSGNPGTRGPIPKDAVQWGLPECQVIILPKKPAPEASQSTDNKKKGK